MKSNTKKFAAMSVISAILMILAYPMTNWYLFAFIAFAPMTMIIFQNANIKQIILSFSLFVFIFFGILLFWVAAFMLKATPVSIAVLSLLFILTALSLYYSLTAVIAKALCQRFPHLKWLIVPSCFTILEYLRTVGFLGFPWGLIGYSQWKFLYFIQFADIVGVLGVGFVIYLVNAVIADFTMKYRAKTYDYFKPLNFLRSNVALIMAILILIFSYGFFKMKGRYHEYQIGSGSTKIALVQKAFDPNHLGSEIYNAEPALQNETGIQSFASKILLNPSIFTNEETPDWNTLNSTVIAGRITKLAREAALQKPSLTVFPEIAAEDSYTYYRPFITGNEKRIENGNPVTSLYNTYLIYQSAVSTGNHYLLGTPIIKKNEESKTERDKYLYYNGAVLIDPKGDAVQEYGKIKLVPFGEEYPFVESEFFKKTPPFSYLVNFIYKQLETAGTSGWSKWKEKTIFEHPDGYKFAASICFESAFGDFTRGFVKNGADIIIVITDDAWSYKNTSLWQHFAMAVFRAVENKRDTLQNGNSGVTAHIDAFGNIKTILPSWKPGYAVADVKINEGTTIYTKYGEWFIILLAFFIAMLSLTAFLIFLFKLIRKLLTRMQNKIYEMRSSVKRNNDMKKQEKAKKKQEKERKISEEKKKQENLKRKKEEEKKKSLRLKQEQKEKKAALEKNKKIEKEKAKKENIKPEPKKEKKQDRKKGKTKEENDDSLFENGIILPQIENIDSDNSFIEKKEENGSLDLELDIPDIDKEDRYIEDIDYTKDLPNIEDLDIDEDLEKEAEENKEDLISLANIDDIDEKNQTETNDENEAYIGNAAKNDIEDRELFNTEDDKTDLDSILNIENIGDMPDTNDIEPLEEEKEDINEPLHDSLTANPETDEKEDDNEDTDISSVMPDIEEDITEEESPVEDTFNIDDLDIGENLEEEIKNENNTDEENENEESIENELDNIPSLDGLDLNDGNADNKNDEDEAIILPNIEELDLPQDENNDGENYDEKVPTLDDIIDKGIEDADTNTNEAQNDDGNEDFAIPDIEDLDALGIDESDITDENHAGNLEDDNAENIQTEENFGVVDETEENEIINNLPDIKDILTDAGDGKETPIYNKKRKDNNL